jgi:hypothetical protein
MNTLPLTDTFDEILTTEQAYRREMMLILGSPEYACSNGENLVALAQAGGAQERERLARYFLPRITRFAHRYITEHPPRHYAYLDLVQEGNAFIYAHLGQFLTRETNHVIPHLLDAAYHAMRAYAKDQDFFISTPKDMLPLSVLSLDTPLSCEDDLTLLDTLQDASFQVELSHSERDHAAAIDTALRDLCERDREIIVRAFGLYIHAAEPIRDILSSMGLSPTGTDVLTRILNKLAFKLKEAYPLYCSSTRERSRHTHTLHKPPTPQQQRRLEAAYAQMTAQGTPVTRASLSITAHVSNHSAGEYLRRKRAENSPPSQQERMDRAFEQMQSQGIKITGESLAERAHVSEDVAYFYMGMNGYQLRVHVLSNQTPQERLQQAYEQMVARGEQVTIRRLQQVTHIGYNIVAAFLQSTRQPVHQPTRSPQERLQQAYEQCLLEGGKITRNRLVQMAHCANRAAQAFLQRLSEETQRASA